MRQVTGIVGTQALVSPLGSNTETERCRLVVEDDGTIKALTEAQYEERTRDAAEDDGDK